MPRKNMEKILLLPVLIETWRMRKREQKEQLGEEVESLAEGRSEWLSRPYLGQPRGQVGALSWGADSQHGCPTRDVLSNGGDLGEHPSEKKCCHPPIPRAQLQQRCKRQKQMKAGRGKGTIATTQEQPAPSFSSTGPSVRENTPWISAKGQ